MVIGKWADIWVYVCLKWNHFLQGITSLDWL